MSTTFFTVDKLLRAFESAVAQGVDTVDSFLEALTTESRPLEDWCYEGSNRMKTEMVHRLRARAGRDDGQAQLLLAIMHSHPHGHDCDFEEAARLFMLAAGQGATKAQFWHGLFHLSTRGYEDDGNAEAMRLFGIAAERDDLDARQYLEYLRTEQFIMGPYLPTHVKMSGCFRP